MSPYDKLVQKAANAPDEEMVDIFRSGWQLNLFWKGLDAFILEDIANACNTNLYVAARFAAANAVNEGIIRSLDFQRFSKEVAHMRTSQKGIDNE